MRRSCQKTARLLRKFFLNKWIILPILASILLITGIYPWTYSLQRIYGKGKYTILSQEYVEGNLEDNPFAYVGITTKHRYKEICEASKVLYNKRVEDLFKDTELRKLFSFTKKEIQKLKTLTFGEFIASKEYAPMQTLERSCRNNSVSRTFYTITQTGSCVKQNYSLEQHAQAWEKAYKPIKKQRRKSLFTRLKDKFGGKDKKDKVEKGLKLYHIALIWHLQSQGDRKDNLLLHALAWHKEYSKNVFGNPKKRAAALANKYVTLGEIICLQHPTRAILTSLQKQKYEIAGDQQSTKKHSQKHPKAIIAFDKEQWEKVEMVPVKEVFGILDSLIDVVAVLLKNKTTGKQFIAISAVYDSRLDSTGLLGKGPLVGKWRSSGNHRKYSSYPAVLAATWLDKPHSRLIYPKVCKGDPTLTYETTALQLDEKPQKHRKRQHDVFLRGFDRQIREAIIHVGYSANNPSGNGLICLTPTFPKQRGR